MPENLLEQVQVALSLAMQCDLDGSVDWCNEMKRKDFAELYPQINQVIGNILEMDYESKD